MSERRPKCTFYGFLPKYERTTLFAKTAVRRLRTERNRWQRRKMSNSKFSKASAAGAATMQ